MADEALPAMAVLQALPQPVIVCDAQRRIVFVNYAAEGFFGASLSLLTRQRLDDLLAFGSPIIGLAEAVASRNAPMIEYRVRIDSARFGEERIADVAADPGAHHGRQDRPPTGVARGGTFGDRAGRDAGA
jgi:two-component system nitrogen regulation sensor histidine kinase GlnL